MRPYVAAALLAFAPTLAAQTTRPRSDPPPHRSSDAVREHTSSLPVTRVSLYKNGVGFFEHTGSITGDADVAIDFTTAQLNDVLQSLTAVDLNGGRISGAGYNSTTPLEQQLKSLPLALGEDTTAADFYAAIRGARVEAHALGVSITGRLLSVENRTTPAKEGDETRPMDRHFLTVVSDTGEIRTFELTPATSVRLLDTALHQDVTRYLQLLAGSRSKGLRHLTLTDRGVGTRELRVSYISDVPIWKSTYRILFADNAKTGTAQAVTLQGWAVVDNTVGEDWTNVQLSLIAGAPQSFIQPISDPIYSRRPEIPISEQAQLTPQTFESANNANEADTGVQGLVVDQSGAVIPNAQITVINKQTGAQTSGGTDSEGTFSVALPQAGQYTLRASAPGFRTLDQSVSVTEQAFTNARLTMYVGSVNESVTVTSDSSTHGRLPLGPPPPTSRKFSARNRVSGGIGAERGVVGYTSRTMPFDYQTAATASISPGSQTTAFDDFFEYKLSEPITIRKNESALVPILQSKIDADRVTLVSSDGTATSQPLRALWVKNTTSLTLDRGSFALIENGNFGGEGLLEPIHAGERRLLSYAADQAVHVSTEAGQFSSRVASISAAKGVLILRQAEVKSITYVLHNSAAEHRSIVLEHPVEGGFTLDSDSKPEETTPTVYRFRVETDAGQTVRLHVGGKRLGSAIYQLNQSDENQLTYILNSAEHNPALEQAIAPIIQARRGVAQAQTAVDQVNARLAALRGEEERQRANITALATADKGSRDRFVKDLNTTEDQIKSAQVDQASRIAALDAAKGELAARIESLQINETL